MKVIKRYFPFSFKEKKEIRGLVINILTYLAAAAAVGILIGVFSNVPVVNWIFGIVGVLVEFYAAAGIALSAFDYIKKTK